MINAIIGGIFGIITMLANAILSPIIAVITALFPDLRYCNFFCINLSSNNSCLCTFGIRTIVYTT